MWARPACPSALQPIPVRVFQARTAPRSWRDVSASVRNRRGGKCQEEQSQHSVFHNATHSCSHENVCIFVRDIDEQVQLRFANRELRVEPKVSVQQVDSLRQDGKSPGRACLIQAIRTGSLWRRKHSMLVRRHIGRVSQFHRKARQLLLDLLGEIRLRSKWRACLSTPSLYERAPSSVYAAVNNRNA